ncbi:MAG: 50S ribosomal protein L23 [bacterium]
MALLNRFKKDKKPSEQPVASVPVRESLKKVSGHASSRVYRLIKEAHLTEKATFLNEKDKYVFKVGFRANKTEVQKAVEELYGVKVAKVNIIHAAPKKRRLGRFSGYKGGLKKGFKKAVVTLEPGEKIEVLPK